MGRQFSAALFIDSLALSEIGGPDRPPFLSFIGSNGGVRVRFAHLQDRVQGRRGRAGLRGNVVSSHPHGVPIAVVAA